MRPAQKLKGQSFKFPCLGFTTRTWRLWRERQRREKDLRMGSGELQLNGFLARKDRVKKKCHTWVETKKVYVAIICLR